MPSTLDAQIPIMPSTPAREHQACDSSWRRGTPGLPLLWSSEGTPPDENSVPFLLCFLSRSLSSPGYWWLLHAWQGHRGAGDMLGELSGWGEVQWKEPYAEASPDVSPPGDHTQSLTLDHCLFSDPGQPPVRSSSHSTPSYIPSPIKAKFLLCYLSYMESDLKLQQP